MSRGPEQSASLIPRQDRRSAIRHLCTNRGYGGNDAPAEIDVAAKHEGIDVGIEKTKRIAHVRERYPHWWLMLVDRIGYGRLTGSLGFV